MQDQNINVYIYVCIQLTKLPRMSMTLLGYLDIVLTCLHVHLLYIYIYAK